MVWLRVWHSCLLQVAKGSLALGQVGLGVNGSVIDALVGIGLVRKLETLSGVCRLENGMHIR